jgi:hypothetical protein
MRKTTLALGLVAGLCCLLAAPPASADPCRALLASVDPAVGTTVTTITRSAGATSIDFQSKSTVDAYATFGPESLGTTGTTGFLIPGADYRIWSFGYAQNMGPLKIAFKSGTSNIVHVDQCR